MISTPICDMLGIRYPIFQGGMAWISDGKLAGAVSEAGGLGIISAMNANAEYLREQIKIARELTDKPFGVNIMLMSPFADEVAKVVAEEKVAVVTTGAGNPSKYMKDWLAAGIKVIPVVASVSMARLMQRVGACAVIAEGGESGGHIGETTTMALGAAGDERSDDSGHRGGRHRRRPRRGGSIHAGCCGRAARHAFLGCKGVRCAPELQKQGLKGQ